MAQHLERQIEKTYRPSNQVKNDSGGSESSIFQFEDNRPETVVQRKLQELANNYTVRKFGPIQRMANSSTERRRNQTGLPENLKSGVENLSGQNLDDVRVHYNSDKPAQLNAHAYAQGSNIHLASGQEKHLPHETWHVVQQKQGRVKPTIQLKDNLEALDGPININDDTSLEKEADQMGAKSLENSDKSPSQGIQRKKSESNISNLLPLSMEPIQRMVYTVGSDDETLKTTQKVTGNQERNIDTTTEGTPMSRQLPGFLSAGLKKNEELKIVGHGDTNLGSIGGLSPLNLVHRLMEQGLKSDQHKGDINLIVCLSGVVPDVGHAVADAVCFYLRQEGFTNRVIGYEGLVHAEPDGSLKVVPPDRQADFLAARAESERLSAIDADAMFEEMVFSEEAQKNPNGQSEFNLWQENYVEETEAQIEIMKDCYVTLGARPDLRRIVNFPAVANEEQWANMRAKWEATREQTLAHVPGAGGAKVIAGNELDPTTPLDA